VYRWDTGNNAFARVKVWVAFYVTLYFLLPILLGERVWVWGSYKLQCRV
jgi:hypothetical protein